MSTCPELQNLNEGAWIRWVESFLAYRDSGPSRMTKEQMYACPFTRPRHAYEATLATGGWSTGPTKTIEVYAHQSDSWANFHYVDPKSPRAYHGCVLIEDKLFFVGGFDSMPPT